MAMYRESSHWKWWSYHQLCKRLPEGINHGKPTRHLCHLSGHQFHRSDETPAMKLCQPTKSPGIVSQQHFLSYRKVWRGVSVIFLLIKHCVYTYVSICIRYTYIYIYVHICIHILYTYIYIFTYTSVDICRYTVHGNSSHDILYHCIIFFILIHFIAIEWSRSQILTPSLYHTSLGSSNLAHPAGAPGTFGAPPGCRKSKVILRSDRCQCENSQLLVMLPTSMDSLDRRLDDDEVAKKKPKRCFCGGWSPMSWDFYSDLMWFHSDLMGFSEIWMGFSGIWVGFIMISWDFIVIWWNMNGMYPLVLTNSLRTWSHGPVCEIMWFPIQNDGYFHSFCFASVHSFLYVYWRVNAILTTVFKRWFRPKARAS